MKYLALISILLSGCVTTVEMNCTDNIEPGWMRCEYLESNGCRGVTYARPGKRHIHEWRQCPERP